jgi:hypothetical protein
MEVIGTGNAISTIRVIVTRPTRQLSIASTFYDSPGAVA